MALRNILRNRRRSVLTAIMMTFGFVFISFTIGLTEGGYAGIINVFTGQHTGHAQVQNKDYVDKPLLQRTVKKYQEKIATLKENKYVKSVAPRIKSGALAYGKSKTLGVEVYGIDPLLESETTFYERRIIEGEPLTTALSTQAIIGKTIAKVLKLGLGEELVLISQGADGSIANDIFRVVGIIGSKDPSQDDFRVYIPLPTAMEFFSLYGQVHELAIVLHDVDNSTRFANDHGLEDPDLAVRPWQVVESEFYKAMEMDKSGNVVTLGVIMFVVAVGVLNTVLMSTLERTREFGVLKAIGTSPFRLFSLVMLEVLIMAMASIFFGALIGWGLNTYFSIDGFQLPEPIVFEGMTMSEMKSDVLPVTFFYPALVVLLTSLLVAFYPGLKVARISPVDAMREY